MNFIKSTLGLANYSYLVSFQNPDPSGDGGGICFFNLNDKPDDWETPLQEEGSGRPRPK